MKMTSKEALLWGCQQLHTQEQYLDSNADSERLLEFVLKLNKTQLYLNLEKKLSPWQKLKYQKLIRQRVKLYPLAYLLGETDFYNLNLKIDSGVFIPRPETELLVTEILRILKNDKNNLIYELLPASAGTSSLSDKRIQRSPGMTSPISISEIGIGSGAIALALLHNAPEKIKNYYANDPSLKARRCSLGNARRLKLDKKLNVLRGRDVGPLLAYQADILIANPPYVPYQKYQKSATIQAEPWLAITDKNDGLDFFRRLVTDLKTFNYYPQIIALEFDEDTTADLLKILKPLLKKYTYKIHQDWQKLDRFIILQKK